MKVKFLLKFYFRAEELNGWLNRLIEYHACKIEGCNFDAVTAVIEDKKSLCSLMDYLESRFKKLSENDVAALKRYAFLRVGIRNLKDDERRDIKRAVMKFTRKLTYIERYDGEVRTLQNYRAILNCPPNMP